MIPIRLDDEYSYPIHQTGSISTLPIEDPDEKIIQLRQAVFDVTGNRVDDPVKQRMGFLP